MASTTQPTSFLSQAPRCIPSLSLLELGRHAEEPEDGNIGIPSPISRAASGPSFWHLKPG
jgi:hypothetical protein